MASTWRSGWPTDYYDTADNSQDLGWHRYSESVPTIPNIPTMIQESTAIQQVSHTEQNPWLIAESQPHPIARHVRYVEPGTRLPIDPNNPARHTDLTRTEQPLPAHELSYQQPYRETETIRHWESTYQRRPIEVPCNSETAYRIH